MEVHHQLTRRVIRTLLHTIPAIQVNQLMFHDTIQITNQAIAPAMVPVIAQVIARAIDSTTLITLTHPIPVTTRIPLMDLHLEAMDLVVTRTFIITIMAARVQVVAQDF